MSPEAKAARAAEKRMEAESHRPKLSVDLDPDGKYRYRLRARNGNIDAEGPRGGCKRVGDAVKAIERVLRGLPDAWEMFKT